MKMRFARIAVLLGITALAAHAAEAPKAEPLAEKVGVAARVFKPTAQRNWRGSAKHELDCMVWYPADAAAVEARQVIGPPDAPLFLEGMAAPDAAFAQGGGKRPLVVLSHGTGGSAAQMAWLGMALARDGMIAVAVNHPGDNTTEKYTPEGFLLWWERATDLSEVLDGMLADTEFGPRIDQRMIGAAGFSLGGYTVLELAGAQTDLSTMVDQCRTKPETAGCAAPEMKGMGSGESMLAAVRKTSGESLARSSESFLDPRVKAVFAIAPALGVVLTPDSLHEVHIPVEVVVGANNPIAPAALNADKIAKNMRSAREFVLPGGVAHYSFLHVCGDAGKKELTAYCTDAPGVEREDVHRQVGEMAVEFFAKTLKWK